MPGEYVPSFGRPDPGPPPDEVDDEISGDVGKLRIALHPVLDADSAARVEEQIRVMVGQAVLEGFRDGFAQAMAEHGGGQ